MNSLTALAMTKLDVLAGLDRVCVCTGYRSAEGADLDHFPYHQSVLHHVTPQLEELPGWGENIGDCRALEDLPEAAQRYLDFVADFVGVPVALVGVGPGRDQVIWTRREAPGATPSPVAG